MCEGDAIKGGGSTSCVKERQGKLVRTSTWGERLIKRLTKRRIVSIVIQDATCSKLELNGGFWFVLRRIFPSDKRSELTRATVISAKLNGVRKRDFKACRQNMWRTTCWSGAASHLRPSLRLDRPPGHHFDQRPLVLPSPHPHRPRR